MKDRVENDLRILYETYGKVLLQKQDIENELRVRQGILNLLAEEEARQAKEEAKAEKEKAEDE